MCRPLVVEAETLRIVPDGVRTLIHPEVIKIVAWKRSSGRQCYGLIYWVERVVAEDVLQVVEEQFLVLLFVVAAEFDESIKCAPVLPRNSFEKRHNPCGNIVPIIVYLLHGGAGEVPTQVALPRPMKSMAPTPCTSSQTRTHLPQRMHLSGSRTRAGLEVSSL